MAELLGTHSYQLDPKGRLSLPATFPRCVRGRRVADHRPGRLPVLLPQGRVGAALRRGRVLPPFRRRRPRVRAPVLRLIRRGEARRAGPRDDPAAVAGSGRHRKEVVVLGVRDRMEIWDREAYDRYTDLYAAAYQAGDLDPEEDTHDAQQAPHRGSTEPVPDRDGRAHGARLHRPRRARRSPRLTVAEAQHDPVMVREVIGFLGGRGTVIDMTLGAGGHAEALLSAGVGKSSASIATPRPSRSRGNGSRSSGSGSTRSAHGSRRSTRRPPTDRVDGVLFDLGVSSMQLDRPDRGFSYRQDGPLDMRMGDDGPTAADLVNELPEKELADLIFEYGQEHRSRAASRRDRPSALARADRAHGRAGRHRRERRGTTSGGPPPRASDVPGAPHRGQPGDRGARRLPASGGRPPRSRGRVVVIAYHSLEDRIVEDGVPRGRASRDPHEEAVAAVAGRGRRRTLGPAARSSARPSVSWRRRERSRRQIDADPAFDPSGLPEGWALTPAEPPHPASDPNHPRLPHGRLRRARGPILTPAHVGGRAVVSTRRSWCSPRSSSSHWCSGSWR